MVNLVAVLLKKLILQVSACVRGLKTLTCDIGFDTWFIHTNRYKQIPKLQSMIDRCVPSVVRVYRTAYCGTAPSKDLHAFQIGVTGQCCARKKRRYRFLPLHMQTSMQHLSVLLHLHTEQFGCTKQVAPDTWPHSQGFLTSYFAYIM